MNTLTNRLLTKPTIAKPTTTTTTNNNNNTTTTTITDEQQQKKNSTKTKTNNQIKLLTTTKQQDMIYYLKSKPSKPILTTTKQQQEQQQQEQQKQQQEQQQQEQEQQQEPTSPSSASSSSWWSWLPIQAPDDRSSNSETNSNSNQQDSTNNNNYVTQLGTWAYSWINNPPATQIDQHQQATESETVNNTIDSLIPNPISQSIPVNSKGWTNYFFSSRRPLPTHKLREDDNKSIESMSIQLSSSSQSDHQKPTQPTPSSSSKVQLSQQATIEPLTDSNPATRTRTTSLKGQKKKAVGLMIPNLVLPSFEDTFHHPPRSFLPKPSKLQQTFELVQALIFSAPPEFPQTIAADELPSRRESSRKRRQAADILHHNQHISTRLPKALDLLRVDRVGKLRKLRRVAVIGIHGWFPGPWLESVLGKPTGTSTKFASMMDDALRKYLQENLPDHADGLINPDFTTMIPLEGDGKVDDRVQLLFKELNKRPHWIQAIQSADAIFVVSHSQGCLVSCKLIEKLIHTFDLPGDRFLSLAMCGIWNGPYVGLNNNYALQPVLKFFEGPAAHELFEFQDPHSPASKAVLKSLKNCLNSGVKYLMIGSMNDQVVPLYSSLNHPIDHPSILRGLFIDKAVFYSTDFLTNLVVFCLRLRNAGFSDHGLIFLLSDYLIGSLNGVGHSTLYEDPNVFSLAVRYFFESSSPLEPPTNIKTGGSPTSPRFSNEDERGNNQRPVLPPELMTIDQSLNPKDKPNPFLLTWSLRGLIEDHRIKLMFGAELGFLKASFLHWNPSAVPPPPPSLTVSNDPSATTAAQPSSSTTANSPAPPYPQSAHSNSKILKDLKIKLDPFKEVQLD
ncbi:hypothetical protein PGT21_033503 [Puccinia graminis f. sp. tritici]|uniref:YMC020W-like alpha/beta hydrolase domain-containing protein n=1 Tax=Puccinia graminis f. sp. tritici TaxID=56615 RepID=A0A5B0N185_PUCGR|nr:hypothetical protein PGT21_033503 [Puccinia graminis f. sp. tritici]KAA1081850.1 hypothetical protein PGTUg99_017876 [Puccinia graminis f. sp. tritici]